MLTSTLQIPHHNAPLSPQAKRSKTTLQKSRTAMLEST